VLAEQLQSDEVAGAKATRRHRGLGGATADAGEVIEQGQQLVLYPRLGLGHDQNATPTTYELYYTNDLC
jgi:hypothetical protein